MFRKIGNPKNALRNNCVGQHHGREYGPYSLRWAVSLARFDEPKNLQLISSGSHKTEGITCRLPHNGPLSLPLYFTFVSMGFQNGRGERDVFLNTARSPLRFPLP